MEHQMTPCKYKPSKGHKSKLNFILIINIFEFS